jgi:hypothetical protein
MVKFPVSNFVTLLWLRAQVMTKGRMKRVDRKTKGTRQQMIRVRDAESAADGERDVPMFETPLRHKILMALQ